MGIRALIQIAVTLAILAVSTVRLPVILKEARKAQLVLFEKSNVSRWCQATPLIFSTGLISTFPVY